jgi:hypothetical protein
MSTSIAMSTRTAYHPAECAAFQLVQAIAALEKSGGKGGVPPLPRYTVALLKNVRDRARGGSVGSLTAAFTWGSIAAAIQTGEPEAQLGAEALLEAALTHILADPDTEPMLVAERKAIKTADEQGRAATRCAARSKFRAHMVGEGDPVGFADRVRSDVGDDTLAGIGLMPDFMQNLVDERLEQLAACEPPANSA